jgi:hypothetical protein
MKRKASPKKASVRGFQPALPLPGVPGGPGGPLGPGGLPPFTPGIPGGGGGGLPPFPPMQPGTMPPSGGGVPPQLQGTNLQNVLVQHPRPGARPPQDMVNLYNMLKGNPSVLQSFIQQRPQSLAQGLQLAQFGSMGPRNPNDRALPGFCYNRWSLAFTFNDVYLFFPVTNLFGFVIAYCFPSLTPCIVLDFTILFALC